MNTLLDEAREAYFRKQRDEELARQYPELQRQADDELRLDKAGFEADEKAKQFEAKTAGYQAKLTNMQNRVSAIFVELNKAEAELVSLGSEAKDLSSLAFQLADFRAHAGMYNALARQFGLRQLDKDFVEGQAQELLKQQLGQSEPFFYQRNGQESDLVRIVLNALSQLTGIKQVSPAGQAIWPQPETAHRNGR